MSQLLGDIQATAVLYEAHNVLRVCCHIWLVLQAVQRVDDPSLGSVNGAFATLLDAFVVDPNFWRVASVIRNDARYSQEAGGARDRRADCPLAAIAKVAAAILGAGGVFLGATRNEAVAERPRVDGMSECLEIGICLVLCATRISSLASCQE